MVSPFPVSSLRMEKERGHMTERMLNLTLEIIYLLTGENYIAFKLCDGLVAPHLKKAQSIFPVQPPSFTTELNNDKKIEEVFSKITELLAGEVPIRCQDVPEERKDSMMEKRTPLTLLDGSRNSPQRCPRPLDSRDYSQEHQENLEEHHEIPQTHPVFSRDYTPEHHEIPQTHPVYSRDYTPEHQEISQMHPLYSQDFTQEHQQIPQERRGNSVVVIKVEDNDDPYAGCDESCKEEEERPPEITTDGMYRTSTAEKFLESSVDSKEDDEFHEDSAEDLITTDLPPSSHGVDLLNPLGGFCAPPLPITFHTVSKKFQCPKCGKCFSQVTSFLAHKRTHLGEASYSCPDCGLCFNRKADLVNHTASHTTDQPYACSYCRKHFSSKSRLDRHELIHTGHKPYSCSMCGKRFTQKANLARHERTHTGEKPFSCNECGKSFTRKATLVEHQYLHK